MIIIQAPNSTHIRRGAGVVERGGLENRCTLARTEGSNPSLSANIPMEMYTLSLVYILIRFEPEESVQESHCTRLQGCRR